MSTLIRIFIVLVVSGLTLVACKKEEAAPVAQAVVEAPLVVPASADDEEGWKKYFGARVQRYMKQQGKAGKVFAYFLPKGKDRTDLTDTITNTVLRGVLSGSVLVFGGPESGEVASMIAESFPDVSEASLKGVKILFIGDAAHEAAVRDAVALSGADYVFLEAK